MNNSIYRESEDGGFTHEGKKYSLNKLFEIAHDCETKRVPVEEIKWIIDYSQEVIDGELQCYSCRKGPKGWHEERVANADIETPIILTKSKDRLVILDGLHRLEKAIEHNIDYMPGKFVEEESLVDCIEEGE